MRAQEETGFAVDILREPSRGSLGKAQGRCVGHGWTKDGFPKNRQVDGDRGGTRNLGAPSPEWGIGVRETRI